METDKEYADREIRRAIARLDAIEKAPLAERKAGREEYVDALTHPGIMGRNTDWLLGGSYGYGEMAMAHQLVSLAQNEPRRGARTIPRGMGPWLSVGIRSTGMERAAERASGPR